MACVLIEFECRHAMTSPLASCCSDNCCSDNSEQVHCTRTRARGKARAGEVRAGEASINCTGGGGVTVGGAHN